MKKILGIVLSAAIASTLLLHQSCNYDYIVPIDFVIPDSVSFSADIIPIFKDDCATSGCHVSGGIAPDLSESNAYFELWIFGYVDTTDAVSSILFQRMNSSSSPMPTQGKLTEDKIQLVLAWIEQGALDN